MEPRQFLEQLVPQVSRNAAIIRIEERPETFRVTIAGTTDVEARCDIPKDAVEAAIDYDLVRGRVAAVLKRCADRTVAEVSDARG